jgi:hypothetical protein
LFTIIGLVIFKCCANTVATGVDPADQEKYSNAIENERISSGCLQERFNWMKELGHIEGWIKSQL